MNIIPALALLASLGMFLGVLFCPVPKRARKFLEPRKKIYTSFNLREILEGLKKSNP